MFFFKPRQWIDIGGYLVSGTIELQTRSQAVARIADRSAQNCRGHVT